MYGRAFGREFAFHFPYMIFVWVVEIAELCSRTAKALLGIE